MRRSVNAVVCIVAHITFRAGIAISPQHTQHHEHLQAHLVVGLDRKWTVLGIPAR